MPKIVIVGCGHWGRNLVRNFADLGSLAGIVDENPTNAEALSEAHNVPALSFDAALALPEVDGIVIATPAETHCDLALRAFRAGKHVYVEKPIALCLADGEKMKAASLSANKILMVGHLLRYHPCFEALHALVTSGGIGRVRYAYSNRLSLGKFRTAENVLWSFGPHDVSMLLALFNEPVSDVAISGSAWVTPGIEDESRVDITFESGARAHVFTSWVHPLKEQKLVVVGESAMAVFEDSLQGPDKLRLYRYEMNMSGPEPKPIRGDFESIPFAQGEPLKNECQHFLDCISTNQTPRTDADEALQVLAVLIGQSGSLSAANPL